MDKKVFKLYWDKDKEEIWLNEMANEGWGFSSFYLGTYTFKKCEKGEYVYRIDLMEEVPTAKKSMDYIKLVEETGAEYVCSWARWVFFRKKASEGEFTLYTDIDSKIGNYKRIRDMFGLVALAEFCIGMGQVSFLFEQEYFPLPNIIAMTMLFALGFILLSITIKTNNKINKLIKEKSIKE